MPQTLAARPDAPLATQCHAEAALTQQRRNAEIAALQPHLQLLDQLHPKLRVMGLVIYPSNIRLEYDHQVGRRMKVLRLDTGGIFGDLVRINRWRSALEAAGFTEVARREDSFCPTVTLRKGTVQLRVDLPRPQHSAGTRAAAAIAAPAAPATPAAVPELAA